MLSDDVKPDIPTPVKGPELARLARRSHVVAVVCIVGTLAVFGLVVLSIVVAPTADDSVLIGRGLVAGCFCFALLLTCLYAWDRKEAYEAITSEEFYAITRLLELRPELVGYRQEVVAEGREFTRLDVELMSSYHGSMLRWEAEESRRKEERSVKAKIYRLTNVKKH